MLNLDIVSYNFCFWPKGVSLYWTMLYLEGQSHSAHISWTRVLSLMFDLDNNVCISWPRHSKDVCADYAFFGTLFWCYSVYSHHRSVFQDVRDVAAGIYVPQFYLFSISKVQGQNHASTFNRTVGVVENTFPISAPILSVRHLSILIISFYTLNKSSKWYIVYSCRVFRKGLNADKLYPYFDFQCIIKIQNSVHFKSSFQYQFTGITMTSKAKWRLNPK